MIALGGRYRFGQIFEQIWTTFRGWAESLWASAPSPRGSCHYGIKSVLCTRYPPSPFLPQFCILLPLSVAEGCKPVIINCVLNWSRAYKHGHGITCSFIFLQIPFLSWHQIVLLKAAKPPPMLFAASKQGDHEASCGVLRVPHPIPPTPPQRPKIFKKNIIESHLNNDRGEQ